MTFLAGNQANQTANRPYVTFINGQTVVFNPATNQPMPVDQYNRLGGANNAALASGDAATWAAALAPAPTPSIPTTPTPVAPIPNVPVPTATTPPASAQINALLSQYGLGSLTGWATQQLIAGNNADQILQNIRTTPEWQTRFQAITQRQAKGLPPISEAQVVSYEDSATQVMRSAGFPPGFYDTPQDFTDLIANDVSVNELTQRVSTEWAKVEQAPPEVRQAFADYFGPQGDTALAMTFVDPTRSLTQLQQMEQAAAFGGEGRVEGFNIDASTAQRAAQEGISASAAQTGFQKLESQKALQTATVGEAAKGTGDISDSTAAAAQFGFDPAAQAAAVARAEGRQAEFKGSNDNQIGTTGDLSLGQVKPVSR